MTAPLRAHLLAALPAATASTARVLTELLDDPTGAAQWTVTDLATRTGTSEATVVRTARSLGFAGYPQLRLALAAAGAAPEPAALLTGSPEDATDLAGVVARLAALESEAVHATARTLDLDALDAAAAAVHGARFVDCCGIGTSGLLAADFDHKAVRVGLGTRLRTEGHAALVSSETLRAGDVALVVSRSGTTPDVVAAALRARDRGAVVVAVTSSATNPLARAAHHVLVATGRETAYRAGAMASRAGAALVLDALYVAVVRRLGSSATETLQRTYQAVSEPRSESRPRSAEGGRPKRRR
ncbi:MurR/RpiR family transcriptional regulator [Kineococcus rhizosphaerae]|uniref:RpiR family transcriptional regulator n=1 Tax=Kineococcus rhizosphaerae TaxID=559628 RepID=A0A2T0R1U9_9ACTN|nr:MurR/RpiR family transcriptional regulator [Kineococcus rhizosphaerae]PRY13539.1 RpiR family transcriptional regulator [Kineococcus rhizosphaerae]